MNVFDSTCAGGSWKATKVGKTSSKIKIIFLITIFDAGQVWLKNKKNRIILIINHHHKRHPLRRLKITSSKSPPPTLFLISHQVRSTQIPPRGLQRKVSNFYYWFLKIYFYGNWKAEIYIESKKHAGSLWFGRNTTQII